MKLTRRIGIAVLVAAAVIVGAIVSFRSDPVPQAVATPATVMPTTILRAPVPPAPPSTAPPPVTEPPGPPKPHPAGPRYPSVVATAAKPLVAVNSTPGMGTFTQAIASPIKISQQKLNFLVLDNPGNGWLQVSLRTRPNGSIGWIQTSDVVLATHDWSIDIDLPARWITVYKGADIFLEASVVIGTDYTPTPVGDYFITESLKEANPNGPRGIYVYGLSGHSDVWFEFNGGDGQLGIHGTNAPQLMGSAASNGCIRLKNEDIAKLVPVLPMGVPVHIHN